MRRVIAKKEEEGESVYVSQTDRQPDRDRRAGGDRAELARRRLVRENGPSSSLSLARSRAGGARP